MEQSAMSLINERYRKAHQALHKGEGEGIDYDLIDGQKLVRKHTRLKPWARLPTVLARYKVTVFEKTDNLDDVGIDDFAEMGLTSLPDSSGRQVAYSRTAIYQKFGEVGIHKLFYSRTGQILHVERVK